MDQPSICKGLTSNKPYGYRGRAICALEQSVNGGLCNRPLHMEGLCAREPTPASVTVGAAQVAAGTHVQRNALRFWRLGNAQVDRCVQSQQFLKLSKGLSIAAIDAL